VGTLASTPDGFVAFEYAENWLATGFSISPLSLPLERRVFLPELLPFEGLFGVFNDSLPDGWGRLLVDRMLARRGIDPASVDALSRLAIVGASGMGALTYEPEFCLAHLEQEVSGFDRLAEECARILASQPTESLDELFLLGGSSGGARPKVLTQVDGAPWIIKFPASFDTPDVGFMEYEYAQAALACGIQMPEVRLFPSTHGSGYFGVKRFDYEMRPDGTTARIHLASASGLLETSHRVPGLDYLTLARLLLLLTGDISELEALYRLMCFNVLAHNRDDHSKNFAFLCDSGSREWRLSPAYDLTYSPGMGGEHATTVDGKGTDITLDDLVACGVKMGLPSRRCRTIAINVQGVAGPLAARWRQSFS
jgi:serine/threonine-protein kinase HipA